MHSLRLGWQLSWSRVNAGWWATTSALSLTLALLGLLIEHRAAPSSSADNTLLSVTCAVLLPACAWASVRRVFPEALSAGLGSLAQHGANRREALVGAAGALLLGNAGLGAFLAVSTRLVGASSLAHGVYDVWTCAWVAALGGAAYAAWFLLGTSFGRRGQGRVHFVFLDLLFGMGSSALAALWPRGYTRQLLGGVPVANLEQPVASFLLAVLVLVYVASCVWRTAR
jgi:hypothetical protein